MVEFYDPVTNKNIRFYLALFLKSNLDKVKKRLDTKDADRLWGVDGNEGAGKSVLAMQICKYVDPTFNINRVCMTSKEFKKAIETASKRQAILFDEGFKGLSNRATLSQVNRMLVSKMMEMRQKNLFVVIAIPSIFMMDKYVALWRMKVLLHVFESKGNHLFHAFNSSFKKKLILEGSKTYNYAKTIRQMPDKCRGKFHGKYVISEDLYKEKKSKAFEEKDEYLVEKGIGDRNKLIYLMYTHFNLSSPELEKLFEEHDFNISRRQISRVVNKMKEDKGGDEDE